MRIGLTATPNQGRKETRIEGKPEEFVRAAEILGRVARGEETFQRLHVQGESSARDSGQETSVGEWVASRGSDPVRVRQTGSALEFHGGWQLLYLSAWLEALAERPGREVRLAWTKGHVYLAESALPITFSCQA